MLLLNICRPCWCQCHTRQEENYTAARASAATCEGQWSIATWCNNKIHLFFPVVVVLISTWSQIVLLGIEILVCSWTYKLWITCLPCGPTIMITKTWGDPFCIKTHSKPLQASLHKIYRSMQGEYEATSGGRLSGTFPSGLVSVYTSMFTYSESMCELSIGKQQVSSEAPTPPTSLWSKLSSLKRHVCR